MKTNTKIQNVDELRAEIARLNVLRVEQEAYLGEQFNRLEYKLETPMRLYDRVVSFFPTAKEALFSESKTKGGDWVTNSLRVGLPFIFNKILFRKAGFIKKGLLLLASQQAAGFVNKDRLAGIIDSLTSFIKPAKEKIRKNNETDYGIPPDSETY